MSELKAILATPHPKMKNACDGAIEVYPKSEADKVIARHKYKRCLAMAMRCGIGAQFQHDIAMRFDNLFYIKRAEWLEKWRNRWLAIAEKFKEGK